MKKTFVVTVNVLGSVFWGAGNTLSAAANECLRQGSPSHSNIGEVVAWLFIGDSKPIVKGWKTIKVEKGTVKIKISERLTLENLCNS
jgi:hypothetical protein